MFNATPSTVHNQGIVAAASRGSADLTSSPVIDALDTSSQIDELLEDDDTQVPDIATTLTPPPIPPPPPPPELSQTITLDTLILPLALREEQLCPQARKKLVEARRRPCSQCLRHGRDCVQTNGGSWKCRECLRLSLNGCEWHLRTVAALGEKWKRPPVDMGLRRRLVASGVSVDRLRPTVRAPRPASRKRKDESTPRIGGARKQRRANTGSTNASVPIPDALPSSSSRDGTTTAGGPSTSTATPVLERMADQLTRLADCGERIAGLLEQQAGNDP